ncbi:alpha/beta fold hydrolase [Halostella litorea]|uniref:alpha/beta fold hydrolase n=1 Tax=Halostella litorea TaxID=2528831 RepID=UPI0010929375|nr:alpha/beta hydrolase [Halostella litorea]
MNDADPTDVRGVTVRGDSDGTPVVFVHGATLTRSQWLPQAAAMDGIRAVAFDLPGHGERADEPFRFERALDLLDRVIDEAAGGRAVVVGLSLGGYLATSYAARSPEKVEALVISGSSANPTGLLGVLTRVAGAVTRLASRSGLVRRAYGALWKRALKRFDLRDDHRRAIADAGFYLRPFGEAGRDLAGRDFRAEFGRYPGPALVLNGEGDALSRRGEAAHAAATTDARVEVLDDAGHTCNLHRAAAYTEAVERFYREAAPAEVGRGGR